MPHSPQKYLADILNSAEFLSTFVAGRPFSDYRSDRGFRSAVERELQIIGEAVLQLNRAAPVLACRISDIQRIIGFRHVLVHGYDSVNPEVLWAVIHDKLPTLVREARALLDETERNGASQA